MKPQRIMGFYIAAQQRETRFKNIMSDIDYKTYEGFPSEETLAWVTDLNQEIFSFGETAEHLSAALQGRHKILICLAFQDQQPIGFKIGFQERAHCFESWRGGVLPAFRNQGVGQNLLQKQHAWCKEQGFRVVITMTNNNNIPMLMVNLRNGFEIVGTSFDQRKVVKVFLQKWLVPVPS